MYVRFGGKHPKTYHSNLARRWVLGFKLATTANASSMIDQADCFDYEAARLRGAIIDIHKAVMVPEKREAHANE